MEDKIINEDMLKEFREALRKCDISDKYREIITLRFDDGLTLSESAKVIGVSKERARRIEAKALRVLRYPSRDLKKYY